MKKRHTGLRDRFLMITASAGLLLNIWLYFHHSRPQAQELTQHRSDARALTVTPVPSDSATISSGGNNEATRIKASTVSQQQLPRTLSGIEKLAKAASEEPFNSLLREIDQERLLSNYGRLLTRLNLDRERSQKFQDLLLKANLAGGDRDVLANLRATENQKKGRDDMRAAIQALLTPAELEIYDKYQQSEYLRESIDKFRRITSVVGLGLNDSQTAAVGRLSGGVNNKVEELKYSELDEGIGKILSAPQYEIFRDIIREQELKTIVLEQIKHATAHD